MATQVVLGDYLYGNICGPGGLHVGGGGGGGGGRGTISCMTGVGPPRQCPSRPPYYLKLGIIGQNNRIGA